MKILAKSLVFCLLLALPAAARASDAKPPAPVPASLQLIQTQAETARKESRIDDAIALYKKGIAIKPTWEEGWWALGTLHYSRDQFIDARDDFRRLASIQPNAGAPWAMLGLAEFETKQYDQALSHLRRATELHAGQEQAIADEANFHLALLLTRNEQYEAAMKLIAVFAQRNLNDAKFIEAMGLAALRKPLLPSESVPTDRQLIMDVGRVMYDASALRTTEAGAEFKILVDKYPETPNIHYLYGSFLMFSDSNNGLAEMKKELEISPAHVPAMVTIANEYIQRKDYQSALNYAQKATELEPQSFPAHVVLGRIFAEGGLDAERGVQELETARKLAPASPQVRIALATAYAKVGRKDDAARERQEFLKLRKEVDATEAQGPR